MIVGTVLENCVHPVAKQGDLIPGLVAAGVQVFNFTKGDPLEPTPDLIRQAAHRAIEEVSQYPTPRGIIALRQAIAEHMRIRHRVEMDAGSQILPCPGSKILAAELPRLFIEPGSEKNIVIGPSLGWPVYKKAALLAYGQYLALPMTSDNGYLPELSDLPREHLERAAMAWLSYPHNPTGACADIEYLRRQYQTAQKFGIVLCSDECYTEMFFGATAPPSLAEVALKGTLFLQSLSKRSGMTGYRSAFLGGDKEILDVLANLGDVLGTAMPEQVQRLSVAAWNDQQHPAERREIFRRKREIFLEFFQRKGIEVFPSQGTFYVWAKAPDGQTAEQYLDRLKPHGILFSPGNFFKQTSTVMEDQVEYDNWFRISLVPTIEDCRRATEIWDRLG